MIVRFSAFSFVLLAFGAAQARPVIVELSAPPVAHLIAADRAQGITTSDATIEGARADLRADQDAFLARLSSQGVAFQTLGFDAPVDGGVTAIAARYTLVFNGMGLEVADDDLDQLRAMPEVKRVHPVRMHRTQLSRSVPYVRAPELYGVPQLGPDAGAPEGLEGQGVDIAIIDSGIEWSHEMFGGNPTAPRMGLAPHAAAVPTNDKVNYYLPLFDGGADTFGHGTHVAATAAGYLGFAPGDDGVPLTADDEEVHGVAPQSTLMGYQVCNGIGSTSGVAGCLSTAIILALEDSVSRRTLTGQAKPVADVINLSLGGAGGPDDATADAADNAALAGAIVVAAAGNDGPTRATVGSPAAGQHVIAVAASNDPGVFPNRIDVLGGGEAPITAIKAPDSNAGQKLTSPLDGRYVYAGLADTPDQVPLSVLGNICLVQRGSTATAADQGTGLFANKAANCEAKGALGTVIFNDQPEEIGAVLAPSAKPVFTIAGVDGQRLMDLGFDASGLSLRTLRLHPEDPSLFDPMVAGFSSRGPVRGLGQVKPDVAAPGVAIMAATTPLGVPVLSMQSATRYIAANGTSMASPHVAGAAALIKQAHPGWSPDQVRTALINTATPPRDDWHVPEADGTDTDAIIAQGGGLIDVYEAVDARALMGVKGDGVSVPGILGSHSFGAVPAVDSRVVHSESVTVAIEDLAGEGGTYDLTIVNNRDLQVAGIDASLSAPSLALAAGGSASFDLEVSIDGDLLRDSHAPRVVQGATVTTPLEAQGFVIATRRDGAETLRLPFYLAPVGSVPATPQGDVSETFIDTMPASDTGLELVADVTYKDFEVSVAGATFSLTGVLEFDDIAEDIPDLDLFLLGPDGEEVANSTTAGGPEVIEYRPREAGTYTWRVVGWLNGPTDFELTSTQFLGGEAPVLNPIVGDQGTSDADGAFELTWSVTGSPLKFEVERKLGNGAFETIAEVDGAQRSIALTDQPQGEVGYRVSAFFAGEIGFFVPGTSNTESIAVAIAEPPPPAGEEVNISGQTDILTDNASYGDGRFAFDLRMVNDSKKDYAAPLTFEVFKIKPAKNASVTVENADNGGSGDNPEDRAQFDYSEQVGSDGMFVADETSQSRRIVFTTSGPQPFSFKAKVYAHRLASKQAGSAKDLTAELVLEFTVDPITGSVLVALIEEIL